MAKFDECFDKAFNSEKERYLKEGLGRFAVEPKTAKIMAFFWNILASGDGTFDDIVHLDKNNNIISEPILKEKEQKPSKTAATKKKVEAAHGEQTT